MSTIEELRQRVEMAERRFGLIDEQQRRYSERLITLMDALEAAQEERQREARSQRARIAELEHENGELRSMLHALLLGVEAGSRDILADTLRDFDARLSAMVPSPPPEEASADSESPGAPSSEGAPLEEQAADTGEGGVGLDAVEAAEQAVAQLLRSEAANIAEDVPSADADGPTSPVAGLIERLAEETQDLGAAGPDSARDETPSVDSPGIDAGAGTLTEPVRSTA